MNQNEFVFACQQAFLKNQLSCSLEQAECLYELTFRMLEVNRYLNLTAITDEKAVILKHYVDSLTISEMIPHGSAVIDVGCGAGFPSLPLAIFRPDLRVTSLDGTAKRIAYVSETAERLGLSNVTTMAGRAEEYAACSEYRESFDVAVARAVASLPVLSELCLPFVRVGGTMLAMKSRQAEEELLQAKNAIALCGGGETRLLWRDLISEEAEPERRAIVMIQKVRSTPQKYPRHFSKISKKPL